MLFSSLSGIHISDKAKDVIAYNIFEGKKIAALLAGSTNTDEGIEKANMRIMSSMGLSMQVVADEIRQHILNVIFNVSKDCELQRRYGANETRGQLI